MAPRNLLDRFRPRAETRQRWPPAPTVGPMPAGKPGEAPALSLASETGRDPNKYPPAVVIGLGVAGERVLRQWLEQLAHDPAGPQQTLRTILITANAVPPLPAAALMPGAVWQFELASGSSYANLPQRPRNRREEMRLSFRLAANFNPFQEYVRNCLASLPRNLRVMVIASLAEAIIGLLSDVLQTLRLAASDDAAGNPILSLSALLTTETPEPTQALDDREIYAALREIGRFTFNGPHWMGTAPPPGSARDLLSSSLLDNLFLVEARSAAPQPLDLRETPFEYGVGQALSEALFVLLQPTARTLWDHLGSQARPYAHEPLVYSLGIATLHVPLNEMQAYIAARLARAALYGERRDRPGEGLLRYHEASSGFESAGAALARRWLTAGPYAHPLFEWLLDAREPSRFRAIPALAGDFDAAFQAQLAHGLASLLNDPAENDQLAQAQAALRWLSRRCETVDGWLRAAPAPDLHTPERLTLQALLHRWKESITSLTEQVEKWDQALRPRTTATAAEASWRAASAPLPLSADWRQAAQASHTSPDTLSDFLLDQLQSAEAALKAAARGRVRRALTADAHEGIDEAQRYYEDTIRPELSRYGLDNSQAFTRVRERLGWWIDLRPGQLPKLLLVLMPPQLEGRGKEAAPPLEARFAPCQIEALGQALLQTAASQAQRASDDLTGRWLQDRLKRLADFLRRADAPLLIYDQDAVASRAYGITRHTYVIARDPMLTGEYKAAAFPGIAPASVNELVNQADPTRFTALSLWLNIPLDTVVTVRRCYERYFHQEQVHLYLPEQLATRYEQRIHALTGQWHVLPPELTLTLVDSQLVTIFCQSVFCGLIDIRPDDLGQRSYWTVLPLSGQASSEEATGELSAHDTRESFPPLQLALADEQGLFRAFRRFVLEEPTDRTAEQNPARHFHPSQRDRFLKALHRAARAGQLQPGYRNQRERFVNTHLAAWQRRGEQDALARAFARLLEAELEEPLWRDW